MMPWTMSNLQVKITYYINLKFHLIAECACVCALQVWFDNICCFLYRLWGEPVNLREQHDALEFFNSLVDSLDEALKALGQPPVLSKVMGGSFADQKICKDCPHRSVLLTGVI